MKAGKLGRLPHDPVAFARLPAHRFGATPPPRSLDRSRVPFRPLMYGNDIYPDCTTAGLANAARGVAALNGYELVVASSAPLAFYAECVGNPANLAQTDGIAMLDLLLYQSGLAFPIGPQALVCLYGAVDPKSRTALANAMQRLGPGWWGVTLRERDMEYGALWDVEDGRDDGAVVGGHCIVAWDYSGLEDNDTLRVGTWGAWQKATWGWVAARLDEAYGLVWRQLERTDGTFYSNIPLDGLIADLT